MTRYFLLIALTATLVACSGKGSDDSSTTPTGLVGGTPTGTATGTATGTGTGTGTTVTTISPDRYAFPSRFGAGDSVVHTGQTARQLLIKDQSAWIEGLTARVDGGWFPIPGDVEAELNFYFEFDGASSGAVPFAFSTTPAPTQSTYGDISTSANLVGKIAGNDAVGQHKDWSTEFVGWDHPDVDTPESLVRHWYLQIEGAAVSRSNGVVPLDPTGTPVPAVYLTAEGTDLKQLVEKFLHGAVGFSQAADDYLDDDTADKGLLADNTAADGTAPYTALEHQWDEGFGYFGASHHYPLLSDDTIADVGHDDTDGNGSIDLLSEVCWGASTNAAKRDRGATVPTDFTADAWAGFHGGRTLLATSTGELSAQEMADLQAYRDQALEAWEKALAATVVHYINDTLQDMNDFGTANYSFADHAKHWSEMKGFALAFQFNPRSPLSDNDFGTLHGLLGQAPVLPDANPLDITAYRADLIAARTLLGAAYGFDQANLGDADGNGGW